jgi:hypothetical protein
MRRTNSLDERRIKDIATKSLRLVELLVGTIMLLLICRVASKVALASSESGQAPPRLNVRQWTRPQSGWLYVLDSNNMGDSAQVLLIDPTRSAVVGSIQVGYAPDIALSPDGSRLYVVSGPRGVISVIDTQTASLLQEFPEEDRVVQLLAPVVPTMTVSPNGHWLAVIETTGSTPETATYSLSIFDALNNYSLAGHTSMDTCGIGRLVWMNDAQAFIQCFLYNNINVLTLNRFGQPSVAGLVQLPETSRPAGEAGYGLAKHGGRVTHVAFLPDGQNAVVFSALGEVYGANLTSKQFSKKIGLLVGGSYSPLRNWPRSSDGRKVYIGTGDVSMRTTGSGEASEIDVFDTQSGQYTVKFKTSSPFWSLALSKDDRYLYGVARIARKIIIFDASTYRETGGIENVGASPTVAIVAP